MAARAWTWDSEISKGLIKKVLENKYVNIFTDEIEQTKLIELSSGIRVLIDIAKKAF